MIEPYIKFCIITGNMILTQSSSAPFPNRFVTTHYFQISIAFNISLLETASHLAGLTNSEASHNHVWWILRFLSIIVCSIFNLDFRWPKFSVVTEAGCTLCLLLVYIRQNSCNFIFLLFLVFD